MEPIVQPPSLKSDNIPVRVIDFIGTVFPEADTLGLYEWASGLILMNVEHDAIRELDRSVPADRWIMQALTHEVAHLLQACMSSFMAEWQSKLFLSVTWALNDAIGGTDFGPDLYKRGLEALSQNPFDTSTDTSRAIRGLYAQIDEPGRYGVSVRSLCESHAAFIEFRTHISPDGESVTFASWIGTQDLPSLYRAPYDLVRFSCGDRRADELFPAIVGLALATTDPVESFAMLVQHVRRRSEITSAAELLDEYISPESLADTTAARVLANLGTGAHPVLERRAHLLRLNARTWFLAPWQVLEGEGLRALDPVVVFRPDESGGIPMLTVNPESRERWLHDPEGTERAWVPFLTLLASVLRQVLADHQSPALAEISWLADVQDRSLIAHVRSSSDIPQIIAMLRQLHAAPDRSRYFGRLAFVFAAEDDPRPDGLIPWVRDSVATVRRELPMIGLYLDCTAGHAEQFNVWMAAASPLEAVRSDGAVSLSHARALEVLQEHLLGLIEEGEALGYNTEPIVANVLARLPQEIETALMRE